MTSDNLRDAIARAIKAIVPIDYGMRFDEALQYADATLAAIEASPLTDEQIETAAKAVWDYDLPDTEPRWHELSEGTRGLHRLEASIAIRAYLKTLAARARDAAAADESRRRKIIEDAYDRAFGPRGAAPTEESDG